MTKPNKWLNPDHIRLMAGEMTAAEMRCVLAVIGPIVAELDAARLDAERYQWIKQNPEWIGWDYDFLPHEVEREVDAAIAKQKGKT